MRSILLLFFLFIFTLQSCNNAENQSEIRNSIDVEAQLQKMNVMLYERGEYFSANLRSALAATPKNTENQAINKHLYKMAGQINEIDSLTIEMIYFLDVLKNRLMQKDNGNQSFDLKHSIIPNNFDLSLLNKPLDTDISTNFFINSDGNSPNRPGIGLFNMLKSYRKNLVKIVGSNELKKMFIKDINDYENQQDLEEKVISQISSKVPNPIDDQQVVTDLYTILTLPKTINTNAGKEHWIVNTFAHSNLIGAISQLTILQNKILGARALAMAHINSKMSYCGSGFDKIVPFAQGPSLIHEGESAEITIGIAAFDSYNQPEVTLESIEGEILQSENGTGKVRIKPKKGLQKVKGTVSIKNKSGIKKTLMWEWDIQVLPKK